MACDTCCTDAAAHVRLAIVHLLHRRCCARTYVLLQYTVPEVGSVALLHFCCACAGLCIDCSYTPMRCRCWCTFAGRRRHYMCQSFMNDDFGYPLMLRLPLRQVNTWSEQERSASLWCCVGSIPLHTAISPTPRLGCVSCCRVCPLSHWAFRAPAVPLLRLCGHGTLTGYLGSAH